MGPRPDPGVRGGPGRSRRPDPGSVEVQGGPGWCPGWSSVVQGGPGMSRWSRDDRAEPAMATLPPPR